MPKEVLDTLLIYLKPSGLGILKRKETMIMEIIASFAVLGITGKFIWEYLFRNYEPNYLEDTNVDWDE